MKPLDLPVPLLKLWSEKGPRDNNNQLTKRQQLISVKSQFRISLLAGYTSRVVRCARAKSKKRPPAGVAMEQQSPPSCDCHTHCCSGNTLRTSIHTDLLYTIHTHTLSHSRTRSHAPVWLTLRIFFALITYIIRHPTWQLPENGSDEMGLHKHLMDWKEREVTGGRRPWF